MKTYIITVGDREQVIPHDKAAKRNQGCSRCKHEKLRFYMINGSSKLTHHCTAPDAPKTMRYSPYEGWVADPVECLDLNKNGDCPHFEEIEKEINVEPKSKPTPMTRMQKLRRLASQGRCRLLWGLAWMRV